MTKLERRVLEVLRGDPLRHFLGPGDPEAHLSHALAFAEAATGSLGAAPARFADLGSGGGVPGLVLAALWPGTEAFLIESSSRRCAALRSGAEALEIRSRVHVLEGRAEASARTETYRETLDLVTARSFGRPAVTAEIATGLARPGGAIVVSEPPTTDPRRWPADGLAALGLGAAEPILASGAHFVRIEKLAPADPKYPRGIGRPAKRPLW